MGEEHSSSYVNAFRTCSVWFGQFRTVSDRFGLSGTFGLIRTGSECPNSVLSAKLSLILEFWEIVEIVLKMLFKWIFSTGLKSESKTSYISGAISVVPKLEKIGRAHV